MGIYTIPVAYSIWFVGLFNRFTKIKYYIDILINYIRMIIPATEKVPLEKCPALVLNADFRPMSVRWDLLHCQEHRIK